MSQDIDVALPQHDEALIVECYLEPGEEFQALVTRSVGFLESDHIQGIEGAEVVISSGEEEFNMINLHKADTLYYKLFNYFHPETVTYEEGKEFELKVSVGGELKASATAHFMSRVEMNKIFFLQNADSLYAAYVEINDPPGEENFYRVVMRSTNPSASTNYDGIWDDSSVKEGRLTFYTPHSFPPGWDLVVNVYHIEKKYYEFLHSVRKAREANYNPFMQPAVIHSTIDGATGVFTAPALTSDTIRIE